MSQALNWSVPLIGPCPPDTFAQRIDDSMDALLSSNSGSTRPAYAVAGTIWISTATAGKLKTYLYDGTSDRLLQTVDTTTGAISYEPGTMTGPVNYANFAITNPAGKWLKGYISPGFNLANGTDAVNDIDFPAGQVASDEATPILMDHAAGTAQLDVVYGTGNGGRFSSAAISDGTWYTFVISNGTTVSRGFSKNLDPTADSNYPAGYTHYRRVGFAVRVSGSIRQFVMNEDDVWWKDNSGQDFTVTNPGTAGVLRTIGAPTGVSVVAVFNFRVTFNDSSNTTSAYVSSPLVNDDPASGNTPNAVSAGALAGALVMSTAFSQLRVLTDTSARVRIRNNVSNANLGISGLCVGYRDTRGRL